jgi:hypothetical protein
VNFGVTTASNFKDLFTDVVVIFVSAVTTVNLQIINALVAQRTLLKLTVIFLFKADASCHVLSMSRHRPYATSALQLTRVNRCPSGQKRR